VIRKPGAIAVGVFLVALAVYVATLAPGLLWGGGDFATFQTKAYTRQIESNIFGHPLWVVLAQPFIALPIGDAAYRANLASAVFAAAALALVFLCAFRITHTIGPSLLASGGLLVSHTFWTYAVMPKPYSLNALLLTASIYFLLRWGQDQHSRDLYLFAAVYGISPLNHLVVFTAAAGFVAYIALTARRDARAKRQTLVAAIVFGVALLPYALLVAFGGEGASTGSTIGGFVRGFFAALSSPAALALGAGAGLALLLYQFLAAAPIGLLGLRESWRGDRAVAALLALIVAGNVAFLLGATDTRTGGEYVWNLHYYLTTYIAFALWIAIGLKHLWPRLMQNNARRAVTIGAVAVLPIVVYALAPSVARPFAANLPGFRELRGRDNLIYVLSPWKQGETGARMLGEDILDALPSGSVFFADYGIWSIINYMQIVEGLRPDVTLLQLPGVGSGQQLPLIAEHARNGPLYLADVNRYYELDDLQTQFDIVSIGPIYRLDPK
jgi:hypothetical protein